MRRPGLMLLLISNIIICVIFFMVPVSAAGSAPIAIHNLTELQNIKNSPDSDYVLVNDIDCAGTNFKPVSSFTGILDGNGYSIKNLVSTGNKYEDAGLFDFAWGATIKNLKLVNVNLEGATAGLVSYATNCIFDSCSIQGVITGNYFTGGIAGILHKGSVTHCSSRCTITGSYNAGGLAGFVNAADISNSAFSGEISAGENTGGAVGYLSIGIVGKCAVNGHITGSSRVGGIAGYNGDTITNSYFIGEISSSDDLCIIGGLAGLNYGNIDTCYTVPIISGVNFSSGGLVGFNNAGISNSYLGTDNGISLSLVGYGNKHTDLFVTPARTVELESGNGTMTGCDFLLPGTLKIQSTFKDWDFNHVWKISADANDGYPVPLP